jgi:hypothetical protein
MTHTSDDKLFALETLTGNTGHVDDLENEWLLSVIIATNGESVSDLWKQFLIERGVTAGHPNDMMNTWLGSLGYTGALSDRLAQYWAAGGGVAVASYHFDASDAGPADADAVWADDAKAFNGLITAGDYASTTTVGSQSTKFLSGTGTNAPASGGLIFSVKVRVYAEQGSGEAVVAAIYSGAELLGTRTKANSSGWSGYTTLAVPTGGWTWAKVQALEARLYCTSTAAKPNKVEIEVIS